MHELPHSPSLAPSWLVRLLSTLAAWLIAFLVVWTLLTVFADELKTLPLPLRALVISGILVSLMVNLVMPLLSLMVNLVMPLLSAAAGRLQARPLQTRPSGGRIRGTTGDQNRA
jgi:antibiotic biosynthesis monooxygenase (ABM) superfamily enzyme